MWRQISRLQKNSILIAVYLMLYLLGSYIITPEATVTFVRKELQVGSQYVFMFLVAPQMPVLSDAEGADVFTRERCGKCFLTNNKGFLPLREYDAVLVLSNRSALIDTAVVMDPQKRYLFEAPKRCVRNKLRKCVRKPRVTSFETWKTYDLCGLCRKLHLRRIQKINQL